MLLNEIPSAKPHVPGTKMSVYPHSGSDHMGVYPWIDAFRCTGCKACARACPPGIIGIHKGKAVIVLDLCQQCGECFEACPVEGAIIFKLSPGSPETGNIPFVSKK